MECVCIMCVKEGEKLSVCGVWVLLQQYYLEVCGNETKWSFAQWSMLFCAAHLDSLDPIRSVLIFRG